MNVSNELLKKKIDLIVNKLMTLSPPEYDENLTHDKQLSTGLVKRDFGMKEWDWPQGVGLYGLYKLGMYTNSEQYLPFLKEWYDTHSKKGLPSRNVNTTAPFLPLVHLLEVLDQPLYKELCLEHAKWIMEELPRTKEGGFQHVTSALGTDQGIRLNESELWIDTLFMTVLFLNKMGYLFQKPEWIWESIHQVLIHMKYLYDKQTGLFHHGWSFHENSNFGGIFWCRGNSWFTYGIMEYIDMLDPHTIAAYGGPAFREFIINTYKAQVNALIRLQTPNGLWRTVLNDRSSYEEVSGSAAIAAGILKGIKSGILDQNYKPYAASAIQAICENIDSDGIVKNVSAGTGVGYDSSHYKNIVVAPMAYGQSLALIALCEALHEFE